LHKFKRKKQVVLLAEHGWQGMRHCALDCAREGNHVIVLIKGRPSRDVREFVSKKPHIKNIFIPSKIFSTVYPVILFYKRCFGNIQHIIFQTTKAEKIVKFLSFKEECKRIKDLICAPYYEFQ